MTKILNVYFHEKIIGKLIQDNLGEIHFTYTESWLTDPNATRISCSLPLQKESFHRKICHAYFGGILPEESQRKLIAKNLGISANNDFSMLEKIGGECAGALTFIPEGETYNAQDEHYQKLSDETLFSVLQELPTRPLLAGEKNIRLSLAGVQDKLAVYIKNNKIYVPLNNAPSTHILKPDFGVFEGVVFNEAFCLQLAKQIGLATAEVVIGKINEIDYLLVKRYDRIKQENNKTIRLHQEDFCQALSIPSINKYQNEGGPSFKQCFDLLRAESPTPVIDLNKMLSAVIFNFLIGNCDAHGKNFSFLYSNQIQFSPLYDLVSTIYYPDLSQKMAMKIGGEYQINKITTHHFDKLAEEVGFAKPEVQKRIKEMIEAILSSLDKIEIQHPIQEGVAKLIKTRCEDW